MIAVGELVLRKNGRQEALPGEKQSRPFRAKNITTLRYGFQTAAWTTAPASTISEAGHNKNNLNKGGEGNRKTTREIRQLL